MPVKEFFSELIYRFYAQLIGQLLRLVVICLSRPLGRQNELPVNTIATKKNNGLKGIDS